MISRVVLIQQAALSRVVMTFVDERDQEELEQINQEDEEDGEERSSISSSGRQRGGDSTMLTPEGPLIRCSAKDRVRTATIDK